MTPKNLGPHRVAGDEGPGFEDAVGSATCSQHIASDSPKCQPRDAFEGSNRLPVLAAELRKAHADVQDAAKTAAERAIAAGNALIEAKELVKHGEWLPWLREHCALAERTAQLYMKIAKSGKTAEVIAAIGLQGAAQVLTTIFDPFYDPWTDCDEDGKRDWHIFQLFLVVERGWYPHGAWMHTEWLLQKGFTTPCEWLGEEGTATRRAWRYPKPEMGKGLLENWFAFLAKHRHRTVEDIEAELIRFDQERGPQPAPQTAKRRRKHKSATVADLGGAA